MSLHGTSPYMPCHNTSPTSTPLDAGEPIPELRNMKDISAHPSAPPRHSSRIICPTAAGRAYAAHIEAAKIHLEDVRAAARHRSTRTQQSDAQSSEETTIALLVDPKDITLSNPQLSSEPEDSIFSCHLPVLELAFMSI